MVIADRVLRQTGSNPPHGKGPSVANLVYKRVSTDQQSTARQNLVLNEAAIEDPVVFEEDPGTSSRLQRTKFRELLTYARPGDTVHISESPRCSASYAAPDTSWTCSTSSTASRWRCASTTARSPRWTSPPATRVPANGSPP
ncbi:recombinase family protein [Streptomyces anulatus]|uniref:recombinase family protein n=1 Tax=Streptomyces anulatus TaxID=1892 RepID=UPI003666D4C2